MFDDLYRIVVVSLVFLAIWPDQTLRWLAEKNLLRYSRKTILVIEAAVAGSLLLIASAYPDTAVVVPVLLLLCGLLRLFEKRIMRFYGSGYNDED